MRFGQKTCWAQNVKALVNVNVQGCTLEPGLPKKSGPMLDDQTFKTGRHAPKITRAHLPQGECDSLTPSKDLREVPILASQGHTRWLCLSNLKVKSTKDMKPMS